MGFWGSALKTVSKVVSSDLFGILASVALPLVFAKSMPQPQMPEMPEFKFPEAAPLPDAQKQESQMTEAERQDRERRRRLMSAGQKTVLTSPLGLTSEADTFKPGRRLLGT